MEIVVAVLSALVFALCARHLFVLLFMPLALTQVWYKKRKCVLTKGLYVPYWLIDRCLRCGGGYLRLLYWTVGTFPSCHIRKAVYRLFGASVGKNVVFHYRTEIRAAEQLAVGAGTIIGDNALLDARRGLVIGRNVNLSSNVSIYTLQHDHRSPTFACPEPGERRMDVRIEDRVWLGCNVIVLPGVTVGEGAVCCAGCVVTKDVEPYAVVAGIPARKVGERPRDLTYEFDGRSCRFY